MENRKQKILKESILLILDKYSDENYNQGIDELEKFILNLKGDFTKSEILDFLFDIYSELNNEFKEEILGDIMNRIHGYCALKNQIMW